MSLASLRLRSRAGSRHYTAPRTACIISDLRFRRGVLFDESDCHRVAIKLSVAGLDRGDDDEYRVQYPKDRQKKEADQDQTKDPGDHVVDEHRDLEVERFFAMRIDLRRVVAFGQPDNERPDQVPGKMKENAEQRAGVTQNVPVPDIR